jgi:hypothetical protein
MSVLFSCSVVVAISRIAISMICLHEVSLMYMYMCAESAHGLDEGALG